MAQNRQHVFVVNPVAGRTDATREVAAHLERLAPGIQAEMYVTARRAMPLRSSGQKQQKPAAKRASMPAVATAR